MDRPGHQGLQAHHREKAVSLVPRSTWVMAREPLVLGQALKTYLDKLVHPLGTHTHTGNLGAPTSLPPSRAHFPVGPVPAEQDGVSMKQASPFRGVDKQGGPGSW